jgi:peptidyl-prolyl cis-trans isomerase C
MPALSTRVLLLAGALGVSALSAALPRTAAAQAAPAAPTAQAVPAPPAPAAAQPAPRDPVVARVNGHEVHLSDVNAVADTLPEQLRAMPVQQLYPMLLDQVVGRLALADLARSQGLDHDPAVAQAMDRAADQALTTALLQRDVGPSLSEAAIRAVYERDYANKPGEREVHARHILVPTQEAAQKIIDQLKAGGDFAALAKAQSTEPGAAQSGGDLGFFKQGDMVPEFAAAAFALKPGDYTTTPVHTQFGWHVIQALEVRESPPQTLEQMHDQIRQQLIQTGVQKVQAQAMAAVKVERFNPDGSPVRATDSAVPPPAPPAASQP